ncbi:MAG: low affinity iron permease family protein [Mesorhizobium sp.]|nr:MAG: low affinity iron permease family protein [Mesorhizobium sp.]
MSSERVSPKATACGQHKKFPEVSPGPSITTCAQSPSSLFLSKGAAEFRSPNALRAETPSAAALITITIGLSETHIGKSVQSIRGNSRPCNGTCLGLCFVPGFDDHLGRHWPVFRYSDTWQLIINTGTTIVTFLMVFLIQGAQNRGGAAIQAKLEELIRSGRAKNHFIGIEHLTDSEVEEFRK